MNEILLELIATISGIVSVLYSIHRRIWVFPTGIISTSLYVYLLWIWGLYGECLVNVYYTIASLFGWFHWKKHLFIDQKVIIRKINKSLIPKVLVGFVATFITVFGMYVFFNGLIPNNTRQLNAYQYVDIFVTSCFVLGMFFMSKRYIEHWLFWIIGDLIAVFLFLFQGHIITSTQFVVFLILAIYGWRKWKREFKEDYIL